MGTLLARHLLERTRRLRLMVHRTPLAPDVAGAKNVDAVQADLGEPRTLPAAVRDVDVVVHLAGKLFAPRPERFLPITNVQYFINLVDAAIAAGVGKIVLASFPQVEGPTSLEMPAVGRLDREPISMHARTRLDEEHARSHQAWPRFALGGYTAGSPRADPRARPSHFRIWPIDSVSAGRGGRWPLNPYRMDFCAISQKANLARGLSPFSAPR